MSESSTTLFETVTKTVHISLSKQAVLVGAIIGILINVSALLIPVLGYVGGGLVAGFVAAYIVGGLRGWFHGLLAGFVAGVVGGIIVMTSGGLLGLFTEPPTLMQDVIGLVSPLFDGMGLLELPLIMLGITAFITIDGIIGGLIGGLLRTLVDTAVGRTN